MKENAHYEKKSLVLVTRKNPDWDSIAVACVAFANAYGGLFVLGIEDGDDEPPLGQTVDEALLGKIRKRIRELTINVEASVSIKTASNNSPCVEIQIMRNGQSLASTADGRYYIRISDHNHPVKPDELQRLWSDRGALAWELQTNPKVSCQNIDPAKVEMFVEAIRASERVHASIKDKSDEEILEYYFFKAGELLTNLGILWIGRRQDRAALTGSPVVQYLKYDENQKRIDKIVWDDHTKNPVELLDAVLTGIPDWKFTHELPDGMFRKEVPHFPLIVVRELVANALVHKPYTRGGDIFINIYPDRMEVHNPGRLPIGVTPQNILHTTVKRNEHLAKVFYDLKLMEREGTGYDAIYEAMLTSGRPIPRVDEDLYNDERVTVTVQRRIINEKIIDFMFKANESFPLRQRELITLGLIVQHESISALELFQKLTLTDESRLRDWMGRLVELGLVRKRGQTRGTKYSIDTALLKDWNFKGQTSLKRIEGHRLKELILQDVQIYQPTSISDIHERIGTEILLAKIKASLKELKNEGKIIQQGDKRWARYSIGNLLANKP